jgi:uncharacterized protein YqgC (DUF456 family)
MVLKLFSAYFRFLPIQTGWIDFSTFAPNAELFALGFWRAVCWGVVAVCMLAGLLGTVLPILPGTALILAGACVYEWFLAGPDAHLGWGMLLGLVALVAASYLVDFFFVAAGARRFGASKYGPLGAVGGLMVGFFLGLPGILLGPPCGVVAVEMLTGKALPAALRASWGTIVGSLTAGVARVAIAAAMVGWFVWAVRVH